MCECSISTNFNRSRDASSSDERCVVSTPDISFTIKALFASASGPWSRAIVRASPRVFLEIGHVLRRGLVRELSLGEFALKRSSILRERVDASRALASILFFSVSRVDFISSMRP